MFASLANYTLSSTLGEGVCFALTIDQGEWVFGLKFPLVKRFLPDLIALRRGATRED